MSAQAGDGAVPGISRREFLGVAGTAIARTTLPLPEALADREQLRLPFEVHPSRVVRVHDARFVGEGRVDRSRLRGMLDAAMTALTDLQTPEAAWASVLRPDDIIGLKFNRPGQAAIGTSFDFAWVLVSALENAGFRPQQLVCIEAPPGFAAKRGTQESDELFDPVPVDFGCGADRFAAVLNRITALISVPFLKTHNIAGVTCAMKNLSHGLVKHPARYHANGCSPFVASIVGHSRIRSKLRLCIVDALRVVYEGGPEASNATTGGEGAVLAAFDPVATDLVRLGLLNDARVARGLPPVAREPEENWLSGRSPPHAAGCCGMAWNRA